MISNKFIVYFYWYLCVINISMQRTLIIIFLLCTFLCKSQMNSPPINRDLNCNHDCAVFLDIIQSSQVDWYFDDDSLGLISVALMQDVIFFNSIDTLITQQCGNYKVVIASDTSNIFVGCPLGSSGQHINVQCFGESSGQLVRVAHSGSPFLNNTYIYRWLKDGVLLLNGYNQSVLDSMGIGDYTVIISDSLGCSDSIISTVTSPLKLFPDTIFLSDINCRGINSGSISCAFSGGRKYTVDEEYDYYIINLNSNDTISWLTKDSISSNVLSISNQNIITFDSLFAGVYILSVLDSFGCILDTAFEIIEPVDYITFGSTSDMLICESDSGFLKIDRVLGDSILGSENIAFGFGYDAINGIYIDSIFTSSGWYDIYVYDSTYFCLDTVPVRCESLYEINVFEEITHVLCFGDKSGSILIDSIIGGNSSYDVQWGSVDNSALYAGVYSVHIVDSIGCLHTKIYNITEGLQIISNEVLYPPLCYGDSNGSISIDLAGGAGSLSFYWLNSTLTADSLFSLVEGVYKLIVVDSLGCIDTSQFLLQGPQLLEVNLIAFSVSLSFFGEQTEIFAELSGGNFPYSINWSDLDTNQQRIIGAGYYEVFVTDVNGCSSSDSILIIEPDSLMIDIQIVDNMSCNEGATITALVSGGNSPYTYLWGMPGPNTISNPTTATIDSLLWEGIYTVFVTDALGVIVIDTIYINSYELITEVNFDDLTHTAEVEIESTTSFGPFGYVWLDTLYNHSNLRFPSYDSISPFLCGKNVYFVTVIDSSNSCSVTNIFEVPKDIFPLGVISLNSSSVDTANLANIWGNPPYTFLWNDSLWSTTLDGYPCPNTDSALVEITDYNDCVLLYNFFIEEIIITFEPASAILLCDLENLDINLEAIVTGGTGDYSFEWGNGSTENPINLGMSPGNFSITVTDINGCNQDTSFIIATMTSECVPNVFSPNGDGLNDFWSLEDTFLYEDSEVRIYGRFGKLLFRSIGYHKKWDGTCEGGKDVPDGVYFYSIEIAHGFDPLMGTVTILR